MQEQEKKKMTIAYIGNGKSTNRYHLPFVLNRPDTMKVKYIWRRNPDHDAWDPIDDVIYTTDLEQVLQDPEVDLVVVNTRHDSHYEYARQVLEAGKNCLVEKPFTETKEQAEELFRLAEEKGVHVFGYQNRRFDSDFLTVQKVLESGKLGDLLEMEMHYDYFRPEVPEGTKTFSPLTSYLYGHGCHTIDQVISLFGKPDSIHYDVRQLLGKGRMNDYFDLDFYYGPFKVSVKSSYFRIRPRPSFVVYGKKGMFVKETRDRQEEDLKHFYLPSGHGDFGLDRPEDFGILTYVDNEGQWHEEKVPSEKGDYARYYDGIYETLIHGKEPIIHPEQTLVLMEILETGIASLE